jgi:hypothetical protein
MGMVQENLQREKQDLDEKVRILNEKASLRSQQVNQNDGRRTLYCLKQKELESLRQQDNNENQDRIKTQRFMTNCQIVEKHLALSVLNNDRKQFLNNFNDKYRNRNVKEKVIMKNTHGNLSPFVEATKKHMALSTYAPDLVKWTKRDIDKLLKDPKKEE